MARSARRGNLGVKIKASSGASTRARRGTPAHQAAHRNALSGGDTRQQWRRALSILACALPNCALRRDYGISGDCVGRRAVITPCGRAIGVTGGDDDIDRRPVLQLPNPEQNMGQW